MAWPTSPEVLGKLEWWLWFFVAVLAVVAALFGWLAREAARHRTDIERIELQSRLTKSDERARDLEQIATEASREATALKERHKYRTISAEQKAKMIAILSREKAGSLNAIAAVTGDEEAYLFAKELEQTFKEAHWIVHNFASNYMSTDNPNGIILTVRSQVDMPRLIPLVREAFIAASIPVTMQVRQGAPHGTISILVGHKPN